MRRSLQFALLSIAAIIGCDTHPPEKNKAVRQQGITKVVGEKLAATEQGLTFDMFDDKGLRSRASTVYYLIADDGTLIKVDLKTYAKTKVGDEVTSRSWR